MKESSIKTAILIVFMLTTIGCKENEIKVKKIGPFSDTLAYMSSEWESNKTFNANKKVKFKRGVILEYGSVNFKNYNFIMVDLDDKTVDTNKKNYLRQELAKLTAENNIFNGTNMVKDGNVYFVRIYNKTLRYSFGSYDLDLNDKALKKNELENCRVNLSIINCILEISKENAL